MKKLYLVGALVVLGAAAGYQGFSHFTAQAQQTPPVTSSTCEKQATLINNRSALLRSYKESEANKYKLSRDKWSDRTVYASQWVPKDAEKMRTFIYKNDELYKKVQAEIDTQIEAYKYLETAPLSCSDEPQRAEMAKKLAEVTGITNRKATGGQALLEQLNREKTKYEKDTFKKNSEALVKKLHTAKDKKPVPQHSKITVEALR